MKNERFLSWRCCRLTFAVFAVACLVVWSVALPVARTEAGSLVIPAWSFARGNARVYAGPDQYADAGPVVGSGPERPWGWTVEYDVDVPVTGQYTLQVCYAAAEARPVDVFFDGQDMGKCCMGVTFSSSGAKWEGINRNDAWRKLQPIAKGKHTVKFMRSGPLPSLVALRLDTPTDFPEDWKPAQYQVQGLDSIPVAFRKAFSKVAVLPLPIDTTSDPKAAGSLMIPACTFDRGNARIYASPDQYADAGPVIGGGPEQSGETSVEYDVDIPVAAEYTFQIRYAAAEARPVDVWLDNRRVGKGCTGVTIGTRPTEYPVRFSWSGRSAKWEGVRDDKKGSLHKLAITEGKHTLKITRRGPLPHVTALRLDTSTAFAKDWKQPERKVDLSRVPPRYRNVFLTPGAVNVATLRLAIQDTMATSGRQYSRGQQYLEQLSELEKQQNAAVGGTAEDQQKVEDALAALRSRAMLAHPALKFDRLLFLKRPATGYGHTYADQHGKEIGGSLCVLSPAVPHGKATPLVPELDGGLFDRFDLSFDAKKVVFTYRTEDEPFRIYEIDIDPVAGKMVPGSLRQLTFGGDEEAEAIRCQVGGGLRRFHDMDPVYLPNGKIMFASTRAQRIVFCAPGASVTTLYLMDADGKNLHRISESPVNETAPSVLDDGRVVYTRWEYVDKGLGNGQALWAVRPDGSGVDHVYKNNTVYPAGMSGARSIPGSPQLVTVTGGHHFTAIGPVVLVDTRRSRRTTEALNCITPEIGYPPSMGYPSTGFGVFMDPYPFSEKFFLVSHDPRVKHSGQNGFGIYVLDAWGNRAELYRDPDLSCFEPIPLRPRQRPTDIAAVAANLAPREHTGGAVADAIAPNEKAPATLFIQNIYEGMPGIERGRVKYVRVMAALEWPWDQNGISWSLGTDPHRKKIFGVAKVHEDGSAHFTAPADENLFFQALDENYMALQQMSTFINLMPGENRSCIGCHEHRRKAPAAASAFPQALGHPVQALVPQSGDTGPRMVDFVANVQVTFDKHCVGCHSGQQPKGRLDLVGVPTNKFSSSFLHLIDSGLVSYRDCRYGASHFLAVAPLTHGSHRSKLVDQIRKAPCKANLTREEFVKIVTWIDANVPYYGTYRGKRNLQDKDHPDFRALPLAGK
ncbi:MAG: hypothetical protein HQ567_31895 [Candidatus Nealsonbacteria bacterium]|nr:hypothetical protein [Candidatus Nealsonbacteria bacterium]